MNQRQKDDHWLQKTKRPPRNLAEWVTFSVSFFILVAIAGLVVYSWITKRQEPPILTLDRTETIREIEGKFYVPFEISNKGGETAESVQVVAELQISGQVDESGEFVIDFLSQDEKEEGAFIFSQDPRKGNLVLRVSSYKLP